MTNLVITSELIDTPRLLVIRAGEKTSNTLLEIELLEVSPSGLYMRYRPMDCSSKIGYWTEIDTFVLIEVLNYNR